MHKLVLCLSAFLILFMGSRAQDNQDAAAIAEAQAASRLAPEKPDSALAIAERLLLQSQRPGGSKRLAAFAYNARGEAWIGKGAYDKGIPDLLQATQLFQSLQDGREVMHMYTRLGLAYTNHSEFVKSANYLLMVDSLAEQFNDLAVKAEVKRQMGALYRLQRLFQRAVPYFRESLAIFRYLHDTLGFFRAANNLSSGYIAVSKPDSSLAVLRECLVMLNAFKDADHEKGMLQERFGEAYYALHQYANSLESYKKAYQIFVRNNNLADVSYEAMLIGRSLRKLKKYTEAEPYLQVSYRIADSLKMTFYIRDISGQLADLYEARGEWQKAYHWEVQFDSVCEKLQLVEQDEKIAQLQTKYEAGQREKEIALLKKDQELNHETVQRQKVIQRAGIAMVIMLVLIGVLLMNRYKVGQKAKRLIEIEKMRNNIARDLHDDMGSALSSINIISRVAQGNLAEPHKMGEHLKKIREHSGLMLENMSDIVWTINPVNDTLERIISRMREFALNLFEPLNIDHTFVVEGDLLNVKPDLQLRKNLYLIFKEAVNNATKYSGCSKVDILISVREGQITMRIADNGIGFSRDQVREGNGLKNMEGRAREIHGILDITSTPGAGTVITLQTGSHV